MVPEVEQPIPFHESHIPREWLNRGNGSLESDEHRHEEGKGQEDEQEPRGMRRVQEPAQQAQPGLAIEEASLPADHAVDEKTEYRRHRI